MTTAAPTTVVQSGAVSTTYTVKFVTTRATTIIAEDALDAQRIARKMVKEGEMLHSVNRTDREPEPAVAA